MVVEVGGGLREYEVAGRAVLDGYAEGERCRSGRGQILAPWPNRLADGRYEWEGENQQLALSEPSRGNAIHGLVRWAGWSLAESSSSRAVMAHVIHPQDGYPFTLAMQVEYELSERGLSVRTTAANLGAEPCPYGAGAHPYLTVGAESVDGCILQAPGASWMPTDERAIPTAEACVAGTEYDFRAPRQIGATRLDTCFGDLARDRDGCARVRLSCAEEGRSATLWVDHSHPYLMLFTGDTLPDRQRRRRSLAVEPMTCAPNAFRTGVGLRTLAPGESFASRWGIQAG